MRTDALLAAANEAVEGMKPLPEILEENRQPILERLDRIIALLEVQNELIAGIR